MSNGSENYRRYLRGEEDGLVEIIKEYKDGLILYLNSFVGNISAAEELAEETFVKIGIKKPSDKKISSFKTWLYTIGRNTAIDYLRRNAKQNAISSEESEALAKDEENAERQFLRREQKMIVQKAMRSLRSEYRQVLWLTYFEGFSCKETAAIMKKTVHSVETLVYRARNALKEELIKEGFIYEDI